MRLWVRAEVSERIGLGHLMRSVAVAQAGRRRGIDVMFAIHAREGLRSIPARFGFTTRRLLAPDDQTWLNAVTPDDAVLFDGYGFVASDHQAARATGARVVQVDDFRTGRFLVDILVNPAGGLSSQYDVPAGAVLLGPCFTLTREEFVLRRRHRSGGKGTLVVALGGSDTTNSIGSVLDAVTEGPFERVLVVIGPGAPALSGRKWRVPVEIYRDPPDVAAIFDLADAAVTAAGTTTWELLTMGIPTALIRVTENQRGVVQTACAADAAIFAGDVYHLDDQLLRAVRNIADIATQGRLSHAALELVDGRGSDRVISALL